jgi:integrase/recombinase XerD
MNSDRSVAWFAPGTVSSDANESAAPNARTERHRACAGGRARTACSCACKHLVAGLEVAVYNGGIFGDITSTGSYGRELHRPDEPAAVVVGVARHYHRRSCMSSPSSTALVRYEPALSETEQLTLLGFLAGYRGYTRDAYALDLRQFTAWCLQRGRHLFDVRRVDIECFTRDLEDAGKARATIARRLCTICGFYRYAEEEGVIERSPGVHIHRPKVDYESHVVGLDRNEVGAILVAAGLSSARDHALVSLMALNGLRVAEVVGTDIDALGLERGHRTLTVLRKGGKTVTMPLAPRVARAIDLVIGERQSGPIFLDGNGQRLDRHAAGRIVRRIARNAGIAKRVGPHTLRHAFITAALDAGVPLRDVQEAASHADPRTTMRYDRGRQSLDRHATYIVATFIAGASR